MEESGQGREKLTPEQQKALEGVGSVGDGKLISENDLWKSFGQTAHDRYDFSSAKEGVSVGIGKLWSRVQEVHQHIVEQLPEFSQVHADQAVKIEQQSRDLFGLAATARQRYDAIIEHHQATNTEQAEMFGNIEAIIRNLEALAKHLGPEKESS